MAHRPGPHGQHDPVRAGFAQAVHALEQGALDNDKDYFTISAAEIKELLNTAANMALRTDMETRSGNRELTGRAA